MSESRFRAIVTHNGNVGSTISKEVVVKLREIDAATGKEFNSRKDLGNNDIPALHNVDDFLLFLVYLSAKCGEVFDDLSSSREVGQGSDVVQRRILRQQRGVWRCKKLLICGRHDEGVVECI